MPCCQKASSAFAFGFAFVTPLAFILTGIVALAIATYFPFGCLYVSTVSSFGPHAPLVYESRSFGYSEEAGRTSLGSRPDFFVATDLTRSRVLPQSS